MVSKFTTEQEQFWAEKFGDEYIVRNNNDALLAANTALFARMFQCMNKLDSVMEFGANIGMNLKAIKTLIPKAKLAAVEINRAAVEQLKLIDGVEAYNESILDFHAPDKYDLVFTKGVLIHINPEMLDKVYRRLYETSLKYIVIAEYYNPVPVTIPYRGHSDRLFKRDFAGEIMDKYPDLTLVDYGFVYHRDNNFPQDDLNWFLMKKI